MNSVILTTGTRFMLPLLLLFSVVVLLRGHNEPGGGFVGGLIAAAAFVLHMLACGPADSRALLRANPITLAGVGLALALLSGVPGYVYDGVLFEARWMKDVVLFDEVKIGTPLVFDIGVYLTVMGVVLAVILEIAEEKRVLGAGADGDGDGEDGGWEGVL